MTKQSMWQSLNYLGTLVARLREKKAVCIKMHGLNYCIQCLKMEQCTIVRDYRQQMVNYESLRERLNKEASV